MQKTSPQINPRRAIVLSIYLYQSFLLFKTLQFSTWVQIRIALELFAHSLKKFYCWAWIWRTRQHYSKWAWAWAFTFRVPTLSYIRLFILHFILFYLNKNSSFFVYYYLHRERKEFDETRGERKKIKIMIYITTTRVFASNNVK